MTRLLIGLLSIQPVLWAAAQPDLSGKWELNMEKSKFSTPTKPTRMSLVVTRHDDVLHAVQTTMDPMNGQADVAGDWFLDGKEHPIPNSKLTQVSKWNGSVLTAEKTSSDGAFKETIKMELSADGKTAVERVTSKSSSGNQTQVLIWNRKQ